MGFTSFSFIAFLIILFVLYYTVGKKHQWQLLLAGSVVFYVFSGLWTMVYLFTTILTTYFTSGKILENLAAQKLELSTKADSSKEDKRIIKGLFLKKRKAWFVGCIVLNFAILAVMKYTNFVLTNLNNLSMGITGSQPFVMINILVPLGISFYTFQSMGYLIDIYMGTQKERPDFFKFALFACFFPQMIQGPISRYKDLSSTLYRPKEYNENAIEQGLFRVLCGFFKKLVIADRLLIAVKAMTAQPEMYTGFYVICVMLFYAITLYADFTGGIDITIGVAKIFGVSLTENFNRPFCSVSIADYWRRWHITMGSWFRDYLFYPLSTSKSMGKFYGFTKKIFGDKIGRRIPVHICIIFLWFITGLWHGASWNFIVWGLLNGVIIIISEELSPLYRLFHSKFKYGGTALYKGFTIIRTFTLMCFIRTLDVYSSVGTTFSMYKSLFTDFTISREILSGLLGLGLCQADYVLIIFAVASMIIGGYLLNNKEFDISKFPPMARYACFSIVILLSVIFGIYGVGYDSAQFIYNQF